MEDKVFVLMHDGVCCGVFGDYKSATAFMSIVGLTFENALVFETHVVKFPVVKRGDIFKDLYI